MYYIIIECSNVVEKPLICTVENLKEYGFGEDDFMRGRRIEKWTEDIFFKTDEICCHGNPDDALQNRAMLPIFSPRLKALLEDEKVSGIQYLPIQVYDFYGKEYEGFHIVNILNLIEAFDYKHSQYSVFPEDFPNVRVRGKIGGIWKAVLRDVIPDHCDIFRIVEQPDYIFVTEKIRRLFHKHGLTGYSFDEVEIHV